MNSDIIDRKDKLQELLLERPHSIRKLSGVPFIVFPYPPTDELEMIEEIEQFVDKLDFEGKDVADLDMRDLIYQILEEKGILDSVIEVEKDDDEELGSGLKSVMFEEVDKELGALPQKILNEIHDSEIAVIHHLGILYPFSSLSVIFSNLENKVDIPFVAFYPAEKEDKTLKFLNETEGSYYRAKVI